MYYSELPIHSKAMSEFYAKSYKIVYICGDGEEVRTEIRQGN